jgi:predicted nuclease with RNAse H fold
MQTGTKVRRDMKTTAVEQTALMALISSATIFAYEEGKCVALNKMEQAKVNSERKENFLREIEKLCSQENIF